MLVDGSCHDPFPELSPSDALPLVSFGFTPSLSLRTPQVMLSGYDHARPGPLGFITSHLMSWPEPRSEDTPTTSGMWKLSEVTWASCDNHATTCHPCHLVGRPISQWTWDLRVPTLFIFNLFQSHCMLILLFLLCSGPTCACSHS